MCKKLNAALQLGDKVALEKTQKKDSPKSESKCSIPVLKLPIMMFLRYC